MRMNETINTMPEYERLRADYEKRLQEVEQNYQKQLIQMAGEATGMQEQDTDGVGIFAGDDQKCVGYEQAGIR